MIRYHILGQSNYAIAILLDTLCCLHSERFSVVIVSNLAREQNDSLVYPYEVDGVEVAEVRHEEWQPDPEARCLIGSIGRAREPIFRFFRERFGIEADRYHTTVHPRATVPMRWTVGNGVHVGPGATIAPYAELADFVVVNRNASVGHHAVLEDLVTVNPGAHIAGVCRIGRGVIVGAGATVVDRIAIGPDTVIGAGSVVNRDLPGGVVAYGVPARVVRER